MCVNTGYSEDCTYCSNYVLENTDCTDCLAIQSCELCYACVDTKKSFSCSYLHECIQCTNCSLCYDCQSCEHCFGSYNLRHKKYYIYNTQYSKKEYGEALQEIMPATWEEWTAAMKDFQQKIKVEVIHKTVFSEQCEHSTGDHIFNNKNTAHSYYTFDTEDSAYCYDAGKMKDVRDVTEPLSGELQLETHACNINHEICFCSKCYENSNLLYCQYCWYSSHLFGCFGVRNKKYCILNKQYTKEEYEKLVPKMIEHMTKGGEWGEFFPIEKTAFGYNETVAHEYFPLSKENVLKRHWKWKDEETHDYSGVTQKLPAEKLSGEISSIPDDIINWALLCSETGRPYKIQKVELEFYRKMNLPIPQYHPDVRHAHRMALRNPRKLWERNCLKCKKKIQTTYAPERPEKVYCEKCYLASVY